MKRLPGEVRVSWDLNKSPDENGNAQQEGQGMSIDNPEWVTEEGQARSNPCISSYHICYSPYEKCRGQLHAFHYSWHTSEKGHAPEGKVWVEIFRIFPIWGLATQH